LGIDETDGFSLFIYHDDIVDPLLTNLIDRLDGKGIFSEVNGVPGHQIRYRERTECWIIFVSACEIPVGENACESSRFIKDEACTGATPVHFRHGINDARTDSDSGHFLVTTHYIADFQ
jgi:hypothetical protein